MFSKQDNALIWQYDNETVRIEAWGPDALRVRATKNCRFTDRAWALTEPQTQTGVITLSPDGRYGVIQNGYIQAQINREGIITFLNADGKLLLREDTRSKEESIRGRMFRGGAGDNYHLYARFLPHDGEKIFGMGQYQHKYTDLKGCTLELAHRNSQVSVPFYLSNIGYGFLWNNPAIGQVTFGKNGTVWEARSCKELDYYIVAADTPRAIEEHYMAAVGRAPMMPDYGTGFWQCKLRYRTQEELLGVARRHRALGLPMEVIIADFFHWTREGELGFDPKYWPDVEGMCRELHEMGIRLMVSVWPTVEYKAHTYPEYLEKGFLVRTEQGTRVTMRCVTDTIFYDVTKPEARAHLWEGCRRAYRDKGVDLFWLDVAEPEYSAYDFENYRYYLGTDLEVGNTYPLYYIKTFYDGLRSDGEQTPVNLVRCAWAGAAKLGALVWSGDVSSTFTGFRNQISAGMNMAIAGIPWWTTDIGGFRGGVVTDPRFRELLLRWFAYGCFCPVMRLHGNRLPHTMGDDGNYETGSGADNEVWSYGEECFAVMKKYLLLREKLRPYIKEHMRITHQEGTPIMRPLFYDFPQDTSAWETEESYMLGSDLLVAPVYEEGASCRTLYLPRGAIWTDGHSGCRYDGGQYVTVDAPIDVIPVFIRDDGFNPFV